MQNIRVQIIKTKEIGKIVSELPLFPNCNYCVVFEESMTKYKTKYYKTEEFKVLKK